MISWWLESGVTIWSAKSFPQVSVEYGDVPVFLGRYFFIGGISSGIGTS